MAPDHLNFKISGDNDFAHVGTSSTTMNVQLSVFNPNLPKPPAEGKGLRGFTPAGSRAKP